MARQTMLEKIRRLDPERDHQQIVLLSTRYEFPFDTTRSLEFALFRTFAIPSISALLDRTGAFRRAAQKRYDDTDLIVSELMEWGYDSTRGRRALRRMNQLHGRFDITNDEFLYVLSTFVLEPIRWNERFGWRPLCDGERLAYVRFWREVGRRMGIRDIPSTHAEFDRASRAYERANSRFAETNRRVGEATRELFVTWFPRPFAPLVRRVIHALLDDPLIEAFGFPQPSPTMRQVVRRALRLRGRIARLAPRRRRPLLRTQLKRATYPRGYTIDQLGPPDVAGTREPRAAPLLGPMDTR